MDEVANFASSEVIDVGNLTLPGAFIPFHAVSMFIHDIEEVVDGVIMYATENATNAEGGLGHPLNVAQCDSTLFTTCTALQVVKYNTRSCAGPTSTSGCTSWAQQTQRGYVWDINSVVQFTSQCFPDVLGAYRKLTMMKYNKGVFQGDYTVSQKGFTSFKLVLSITCV